MKEPIRFKGLTLNGDEQQATHGELALCGNMEIHDGALRPSVLKGTMIGNAAANFYGELVYVHTGTSYTNYIAHMTYSGMNKIVYNYLYDDGTEEEEKGIWQYTEILDGDKFNSLKSVTSVGNTLCILTDTGLWYALFKNGSYILLGQQPPFIELQFNLKLDTYNLTYNREGNDRKNSDDHFVSTPEDWFGDMDEDDQGNGRREVKKEFRSTITEQVMAKINHRIDKLTGEGYFYAPFLVRYCYRMFDGSMFMHSAPVLMASMLAHPVLTWVPRCGESPTEEEDNMYFIFLFRCALQACCIDTSVIETLQNWSDVIKSLDIFVTPQFSRIDTSGTIDYMSDVYDDDHNICTFDGKTMLAKDLINHFHFLHSYYTSIHWGFNLPEYSEEEHFTRIKNASVFYKLCSINTTNLAETFTTSNVFRTLDYDGYVLKNITVQEQMTDDYKTHNLLSPMDANSGGMYVYNHRLNVYGIKETLFKGFSVRTLYPYADPGIGASWIDIPLLDVWRIAHTDVAVNTDSGVRVVMNTSAGDVFRWMIEKGYVFYPDSRAVRMEFSLYNEERHYYRELEDSPGLNGAFSFFAKSNPVSAVAGIIDPEVAMPNKLYTSRADNPFYFPNLPGESGINSVGTGEIIGLAAVTRALSPGQVGDHDLLVFASDGIWALKVSPTGTYSAMHNISREVCTNPKSICQLDQSVVFATKRSLSQIRESDSVSLSDVLDGPLPSLSSMLSELYKGLDKGSDAKVLFDFGTPAIDIFQSGQVLYDFASARLVVFDASKKDNISLVFSLKDKAWSTMRTDYIRAAVSGYPYPYVQIDAYEETVGIIVDRILRLDLPYDHDTGTSREGIVITRTLTYSDTMDVIRGFRQYCQCASMPTLWFFGSNDQISWQYIGRSARAFHNYMPGHPFRFFRVAMLIDQMKMSERYQQLTLEIVNKYAKL